MPEPTAGTDEEGRPIVHDAAPEAKLEGEEVVLQPERPCAHCGHVLKVAQVVRLDRGRYDYACVGCAVKTGQ